MSFKDIIVHVDVTEAGAARTQLAAEIAAVQGGYLTGLFVRTPPTPQLELPVFTDLGTQGGAYREALQQMAAAAEIALQEGEAAFRRELARAQIEGEWVVAWSTTIGAIDARARYADLIVLGQGGGKNAAAALDPRFPAELALACGRPVLTVPVGEPPQRIGDRVLIAWNGSREAARAVSDAMPFLERAKFVTTLAVEPPWRRVDQGMNDLAPLVAHLKRYRVNSERYVVQASEHEAGAQILAEAQRADCDLIVMGAYGHSHMREIVLGGATHTLLNAATVPILLSH